MKKMIIATGLVAVASQVGCVAADVVTVGTQAATALNAFLVAFDVLSKSLGL